MDVDSETSLDRAHRLARQAEQALKKGHLQQAIDKHTRASRSFLACVASTFHQEGHHALELLAQFHQRQACLIQRAIQKKLSKNQDATEIKQQPKSKDYPFDPAPLSFPQPYPHSPFVSPHQLLVHRLPASTSLVSLSSSSSSSTSVSSCSVSAFSSSSTPSSTSDHTSIGVKTTNTSSLSSSSSVAVSSSVASDSDLVEPRWQAPSLSSSSQVLLMMSSSLDLSSHPHLSSSNLLSTLPSSSSSASSSSTSSSSSSFTVTPTPVPHFTSLQQAQEFAQTQALKIAQMEAKLLQYAKQHHHDQVTIDKQTKMLNKYSERWHSLKQAARQKKESQSQHQNQNQSQPSSTQNSSVDIRSEAV